MGATLSIIMTVSGGNGGVPPDKRRSSHRRGCILYVYPDLFLRVTDFWQIKPDSIFFESNTLALGGGELQTCLQMLRSPRLNFQSCSNKIRLVDSGCREGFKLLRCLWLQETELQEKGKGKL